ncbi:sortase B protein-sorting domain-containing protein [Clostridium botulinum]|nr:sortase B protein-sorting domain-containing protein [Clostridium botulinum]NFP40912.1 sortase B protein-sorting domain-containing protein [Clostridium botulinum]NFQ57317.1 sortase B protein-sorting domain-containing protein [Clostridium botulinum]
MHISPKITKHSSPLFIGIVKQYPPDLGTTIGTSKSIGISIHCLLYSQSDTCSLKANCTVTVCSFLSKPCIIPGHATFRLLFHPSPMFLYISLFELLISLIVLI